jgi:hypothetical protein
VKIYRMAEEMSKSLILKKINDFLKELDEIEYGWIDSSGKKYNNTNEEDNYGGNVWWTTYFVMSPEEVLSHKVGTCIDQTILAKKWFDEELPLVTSKIVWVENYNDNDHMCLVFKLDEEWYWFEHAWGDKRGIHGGFKDIQEIIDDVVSENNDGFKVKVMDDFKYKPNLTAKNFLKMMDYDFSKEEW